MPGSAWSIVLGLGAGLIVAALGGCANDVIVPSQSEGDSIAIMGGNAQTGAVGQSLDDDLSVQVVDQLGRPVADLQLDLVLPEGGAVSPSNVATGGDGAARFRWTLGPRAGDQRLEAGAGDMGKVTFHAQAVPGSPAADHTDADVPNGSALGITAITIHSRDGFGNPRTSGGYASHFQVTLTGANNASPPVVDQQDGSYSARYLALLPGTDQVSISLDGQPIEGSPYQSIVEGR